MCHSFRMLVVGSYVPFRYGLVVDSYVPFWKGVGLRLSCATLVGGWWKAVLSLSVRVWW
jgi:hypothetical protein